MPAIARRRLGAAAVLGVAAAVAGTGPGAGAARLAIAQHATFSPSVRADVGDGPVKTTFGPNEPQVAVDQTGLTYVTWQSDTKTASGQGIATTRDGTHFSGVHDGDTQAGDTGDVALATTSWTSPTQTVPVGPPGSQGVFYSVLGQATCPTGPGVFEIRNSTSTDQGTTWKPTIGTCQPAQVDRNWTAAYTPPQYRGTPDAVKHTIVYDTYHDFGISNMWVSVSTDGGATFSPVQLSAEQPGSVGMLSSICNITPGGIAVDQRGKHPGRVYVAWTAADVPRSQLQGCNLTEAAPFTHVFVSYSDSQGAVGSWVTRTAYSDTCAPNPPAPPVNFAACSDDQEIFPPIAVDDAGNVFVAVVMRDATQPNPEFDIGVPWSTDGGNTFSGGTVDHPGKPPIANTDRGTHYFPWLTAAGNGGVDVVWYRTPFVQGQSNVQKPSPAPGSAVWNVFMGQSLDLVHGAPFVQSKVSDHDIYYGDICTVGIFCGNPQAGLLGTGPDRILLDNFGIAIGPDGGARIAWTDTHDSWTSTCKPGGTDDSNVPCQATHLLFACQTSGNGLHGETVTGCGQSRGIVQPTPTPTPTPVSTPTVSPEPIQTPAPVPGLVNTSAAGGPATSAAALSAGVLLGVGVLRRARRRRRHQPV